MSDTSIYVYIVLQSSTVTNLLGAQMLYFSLLHNPVTNTFTLFTSNKYTKTDVHLLHLTRVATFPTLSYPLIT